MDGEENMKDSETRWSAFCGTVGALSLVIPLGIANLVWGAYCGIKWCLKMVDKLAEKISEGKLWKM